MRVCRVSGSGPARKRFRLNRKTLAQLAGFMVQSRPRVWKRLRHVGLSGSSLPDHTRRRCDHADGGSVHEHDRVEVGQFPGIVQAHVSRIARLVISLV